MLVLFIFLLLLPKINCETGCSRNHYLQGINKFIEINPSVKENIQETEPQNGKLSQEVPPDDLHIINYEDPEFPLEKENKILLENRDAEISNQSKEIKRYAPLSISKKEVPTEIENQGLYGRTSSKVSFKNSSKRRHKAFCTHKKCKRNIFEKKHKTKLKNKLARNKIKRNDNPNKSNQGNKSSLKQKNETDYAEFKNEISELFGSNIKSDLNDFYDEGGQVGSQNEMDISKYRPSNEHVPKKDNNLINKNINHEPTVLFDDYAQDDDSVSLLQTLVNLQTTTKSIPVIIVTKKVADFEVSQANSMHQSSNTNITHDLLQSTIIRTTSIQSCSTSNQSLPSTSSTLLKINASSGQPEILQNIENSSERTKGVGITDKNTTVNKNSMYTQEITTETNNIPVILQNSKSDHTINDKHQPTDIFIPVKKGTTEDICKNVNAGKTGFQKGTTRSKVTTEQKLGQFLGKLKNNSSSSSKTTKSAIVILGSSQEMKTTPPSTIPLLKKIFGVTHKKTINTKRPAAVFSDINCGVSKGNKIYPVKHKGVNPNNNYYPGKHPPDMCKPHCLQNVTISSPPAKKEEHLPNTSIGYKGNKNLSKLLGTMKTAFIPKKKVSKVMSVTSVTSAMGLIDGTSTMTDKDSQYHRNDHQCESNDIKDILPQQPQKRV